MDNLSQDRVGELDRPEPEFQEERIPVALRPVWGYQSYCSSEGPQLVKDLQKTVDRREQIYPLPMVPI